MPTLEELEAERKEKMRRLALMLENKQKYSNWAHEQEQRKREELAQQQADTEKRWGDDTAKGAATGFAVSGSPWGALIGGGVGTLGGMHRAYKQRRKEGHDPAVSAIGTLTDFPAGLPSGETATGLSPGVAQGAAGYQSRTQGMGTKPTPTTGMQTIAGLTPEERDQKKSAYFGGLDDPYADMFELTQEDEQDYYSGRKKKKGRK